MRLTKAAVFSAVLALGMLGSMGQAKITRGWAFGLFADGSASAPSISFATTPTSGAFLKSGGIAFTNGGTEVFGVLGGTLELSSGSTVSWGATSVGSAADTILARGAAGVLTATGASGTNGIRLQFNGAPTVGTCGTSPSITSGSRDTAGSVNVGTGGTATSCGVTFNATWASAPFCVANGTTTTAGNVRALAVNTTTTAMTITAASAWAASEVVQWVCVGSK